MTSISTSTLEYLVAVRDVQYQMVAASSFLVWDFLLTFGDEVEYAWRMRRCMFKWFYFYFRYFLLAVQICHLAITPVLSSGHAPDTLCTMWRRYVIFIPQLSISLIDVILATRVFALFNRSRKVAVFLGSLILLDSGFAVTHMAKCPSMKYLGNCRLLNPQNDFAKVHASSILVVQSTIVGMIIFKHSIGVKLGWGRTPLLSFLVKDAASNYVTIFLLCGISLTTLGFNDQRVIAIFYWSISLLSAIGCRLVINMERFARGYILDEDIQLTSHITL